MRPLPLFGDPMYRVIFWAALLSWILPEVIAWKVKRSADTSKTRDQGSLNLIVLLWWAGIVMDFVLSIFLPKAAIQWKRTFVFLVGICLMLAGIGLRWYSAAILGKYFTFDVAIQTGQTLVESGPYRYVRHPSYSGAMLSLLGLGLALGNWAGLLVALCCMGLAYAYRISVEEAALTAALGDSYKQYVSRTWRLVPFVF